HFSCRSFQFVPVRHGRPCLDRGTDQVASEKGAVGKFIRQAPRLASVGRGREAPPCPVGGDWRHSPAWPLCGDPPPLKLKGNPAARSAGTMQGLGQAASASSLRHLGLRVECGFPPRRGEFGNKGSCNGASVRYSRGIGYRPPEGRRSLAVRTDV